MNTIGEGGILGNAEKAVDMSKVSAMQNEIKMVIAKKVVSSSRNITIKDIIEQLEKQGLVNIGDSNIETGEVKTQPDGYVYEITEKANDWEVTYIGKSEITQPEVVISLTSNTTGLTNEVVITMTAEAESGITSYTLPKGIAQSVASGTNEITKTYTATENGTYVFTVVNGNGKTVTKSITINNILEGVIQISANKTAPTYENVTVTIIWPSDANKALKQIQIGEGIWQTVTGTTNQVTVSQNCVVTAQVKNSIGELTSASLTISNIDKTKPTITATAGTEIIDWQTSKDISSYFTVVANGTTDVTDIMYVDTSNGNAEVENTNTLTVGTHIIQCIATKETGAISTVTKTIEVEPLVFGNLYKISDTEYHLIFNGTGAIAQGYTEEQLVARGTNIKDGSGYEEISEGIYQSDQPWVSYSENITKVKIEEKIKPRSTAHYFNGLSKITEIDKFYNLDTSNVTEMQCMFYNCSSLTNLDISNWNTSNVTTFEYMFSICSSLTSLDVSKWDTGNVTSMRDMFISCSSLTSLDVSNWNTSRVTIFYSLFHNCSNLTSLDVSKWNTENARDMKYMFTNCSRLKTLDVSNWNTESVTEMQYMFYNCSNLTSLDVSKWNTSNITNFEFMFSTCSSLTNLDVSKWDTGNVTSMRDMFISCSSLTSLDVIEWNTSNVTNFQSLFHNCSSLSNLDVSKWNTGKVTNMQYMFTECSSLTTLDLGKWNTESVTEMQYMFINCSNLSNLNISNWNTSSVTNLERTFYGCSALTSLYLSNWNTSKVTNMYQMFALCGKLSKIYVGTGWTTNAVTSSYNMFYDCTSLSGAISFNAGKVDATYANYTTGYFTKAT